MKGKQLKNKEKSINVILESLSPDYRARFKILDLTSTHCEILDTKYNLKYEADRKLLHRESIPLYSKHLDWQNNFYEVNKDRFSQRERPEEYLGVYRRNSKTYIKYRDILTGLEVEQRDEVYFSGYTHRDVMSSLEEFVRTLDPEKAKGLRFVSKKSGVLEYIDEHGNLASQRVDSFMIGKRAKITLKSESENRFFTKAKEIHGDKYDYSMVEYKTINDNVDIYCNTCNKVFSQRPANHIGKQYGCTHCWRESKTSAGEREWRTFFTSRGYEVETNTRPEWLGGKEIDIFIPELNLGVEYNGLAYHSTFDSSGVLPKYVSSNYHLNKYETCKANGVSLIHIFEHEEHWEDVLTEYLSNPSNYRVSFENIGSTVKYTSKEFTYFGKSFLEYIE